MPIGVPRILYCWGEELPTQWTDIYNFIFRRRMVFLMQYLDDELCNQICGLLINIHMEDRAKELEKKETENFIKESENKFEQLMVHKKKSLEQKLVQMKNKAIKDIQYISNKIALETVKKVILDTSNLDKIKIINKKNIEKTLNQLKQAKIS